jgi:clan AA aspartic protease (TIGR02281 family)
VLKAIARTVVSTFSPGSLKSLILLGAVVLALCGTAVSAANTEFDLGVASYKKRDFKSASFYFDNALKRNRNDYNALYYKAACLTQLGKPTEAKYIYAVLIKSFPSTDAARNAESAMAYLDPTYLRQLKGQSPATSRSSSSSSDTAGGAPAVTMQSLTNASPSFGELVGSPLPSTVYFENMGNNLLVQALINNRKVPMLFDSGAYGCTIGLEQVKELGLRPPEGPPTGRAGGVGGSGSTGTWQMMVTLRVGTIEKRNFPIIVIENSNVPALLGQTFFREYTYSIDNVAKSIRFQPKQGGSAVASRGSDASGIPFTREGNHIIVNVSFNGKTIPCYLDTGASGTVLTYAHCRELGITVPDDAERTMSQGVGGVSMNKTFPVGRVQCGPISKNDLTISVTDNTIPHPLLGQNFFGNLRYEVDDENHVIRMRY